MDKQTQSLRIYNHLMRGHTLTALDALNRFQCLRLAARIKQLRDQGVAIEARKVRKGEKWVAEYRMAA